MSDSNNNTDQSIEIHHTSIVEIMSKPPARMVKIGSGIILLLFSLLIIGSYFFTFSDTLKVPIVISDNKAYAFLVSPATGKLIKKMHADNFKVNQGDTISIIKSLTSKKEIFYLVSSLKGDAEMNPLWSFQSNVAINDTLGMVYEDTTYQRFGIIHLGSDQIGKIKIGSKVNVFLDRYPSDKFGIIESNIRSISNFNNDKDFMILVKIPQSLSTSKGKKLPGLGKLTGTASIVLNEESLFARLLNPFRGLLE